MKKQLLIVVIAILVVSGRYFLGNQEFQSEGHVTELYIIRGLGSSYVNFDLKFFLVLVLIILVVYDWRQKPAV